jgi:hypothetical protein
MMSIPATSAASERAFSTGKDVMELRKWVLTQILWTSSYVYGLGIDPV